MDDFSPNILEGHDVVTAALGRIKMGEDIDEVARDAAESLLQPWRTTEAAVEIATGALSVLLRLSR